MDAAIASALSATARGLEATLVYQRAGEQPQSPSEYILSTEHNCTSGAAAVRLRRGKRKEQHATDIVVQRRVRARAIIEVDEEAGRKRKRHTDSQLAYNVETLHKLQKVVGAWYHTLQPFGDG